MTCVDAHVHDMRAYNVAVLRIGISHSTILPNTQYWVRNTATLINVLQPTRLVWGRVQFRLRNYMKQKKRRMCDLGEALARAAAATAPPDGAGTVRPLPEDTGYGP